MALTFEWSIRKAAQNLRKHGVTFEEAASCFGDPLSLSIPDPDHSEAEERWVLAGMSKLGRLLVVSHTDHQGRIRIISGRLAARHERKRYEEG